MKKIFFFAMAMLAVSPAYADVPMPHDLISIASGELCNSTGGHDNVKTYHPSDTCEGITIDRDKVAICIRGVQFITMALKFKIFVTIGLNSLDRKVLLQYRH